jgi:hypothetical protein
LDFTALALPEQPSIIPTTFFTDVEENPFSKPNNSGVFICQTKCPFGKPSSMNQVSHKIPGKLFLREVCVSFAV